MAAIRTERVTQVHHWNEDLFSFRTTRDPAFRFENGQFVMIGLPVNGKPLLRAYSIASANYEEELEFFSIKVQHGALTSRLQSLQVGDEVLVSSKPTGTLLLDDLLPGKRLYLLSTGTGLAPFLSLVRDFRTYEKFEHVVVFHGVRNVNDLAYFEFFTHELQNDELLGDMVRQQLKYYPCVTREPFHNQGRVTDVLPNPAFYQKLGLPMLDPEHDRLMLCGSPTMLKDTVALLDARGFKASPAIGEPGDYVIERAFVEK